MNYYMHAYVELTWWFYDVEIKWWIITWMFICWWTMIWNAYVELTWWISMRLWYWSCTLLLTLSLMSYVVFDVVIDVLRWRCWSIVKRNYKYSIQNSEKIIKITTKSKTGQEKGLPWEGAVRELNCGSRPPDGETRMR